jgi:hypothetical protein
MATEAEHGIAGMVEGIVVALANKHSELEVEFNDLALNLGGTPVVMRLSGGLTLTAHLRDMTTEERNAHAAHQVAALKA